MAFTQGGSRPVRGGGKRPMRGGGWIGRDLKRVAGFAVAFSTVSFGLIAAVVFAVAGVSGMGGPILVLTALDVLIAVAFWVFAARRLSTAVRIVRGGRQRGR